MCSIHFLSFLSFYGHHGTRLSARPNTHNTPSIGFCASLPPPLSHQPIVGTKWHLVFAFGCPFCSYPLVWCPALSSPVPTLHTGTPSHTGTKLCVHPHRDMPSYPMYNNNVDQWQWTG